MNVTFFGSPNFVLPVLTKLIETPFLNVVSIITTPCSPIEHYANTHQIPTVTLEELLKKGKPVTPALNADIFIVAAYGKFLPEEVITLPHYLTLNLHPSLLPKLRGTTPIQTAILEGSKATGITIMQMDRGMDKGPVIAQTKVFLTDKETTLVLSQKLFSLGAELLVYVLPLWAKYINDEVPIVKDLPDNTQVFLPPRDQDHNLATFTKKLTKEDGKIDWSKPSKDIDRQVRALNPWPGTWTTLAQLTATQAKNKSLRNRSLATKRVKILETHLDDKGKLVIDRVQVEGKKPVSWKEFVIGYLH